MWEEDCEMRDFRKRERGSEKGGTAVRDEMKGENGESE